MMRRIGSFATPVTVSPTARHTLTISPANRARIIARSSCALTAASSVVACETALSALATSARALSYWTRGSNPLS
jgi:hypothetical protein